MWDSGGRRLLEVGKGRGVKGWEGGRERFLHEGQAGEGCTGQGQDGNKSGKCRVRNGG